MQLDRFVSRTLSRAVAQIAVSGLKSGIAGLRQKPAPAPKPEAPKDDLRGSGSWANEWDRSPCAAGKAKVSAKKAKKTKVPDSGAPVETADVGIVEGSIRPRPLMSSRDVALFNWIADRLEIEAPMCSIHAGVSLSAFLAADTAPSGRCPLMGLIADFVIVDQVGQPVVAMIRDDAMEPAGHLLAVDALLDADLPIVDIQPRPKLSPLWDSISQYLPEAD